MKRQGNRPASLTILFVIAIAIIGLSIVVSTGAAQHLNGSPCGNPPARTSPQFPYPIVVVILCSAAALLGRLAGYLREPAPGPAGGTPAARGWVAPVVQSWVALFLLTCAFLLGFETITLAVGVWPITFYIRCAYDTQAFATIAGACLTTFLLGHWLWFPTHQEEES